MKRNVIANFVFCLLSAVVLLHPSSLAAGAPVYKWVDQNGQVHFGDRKSIKNVQAPTEQVVVKHNVIEVERRGSARQPVYRPSAQVKTKRASASAKSLQSHKSGALCENAERGLEAIRSRMRHGYKASEQKRLREREYAYQQQRNKYCR